MCYISSTRWSKEEEEPSTKQHTPSLLHQCVPSSFHSSMYQTVCPLSLVLSSTRWHIPSSTPPNRQMAHPHSPKKPVHVEPTSHSSLSSPSSEVCGDTQVVVMALCTTGTPDLELSLYIKQTAVHQQLEWGSNKHAGMDKKHEVVALYSGCLSLRAIR